VLGAGAVGGDRGVVGGGGAPLGVADGVPWVDETVGGVVDLVKGELAAGLLPADLGGEGLREGGAEGERSGGPAGGPRTDDLCLAGAGWLVCTACDGPEGTSWLLTGLNEAPTSSHTSFRRCTNSEKGFGGDANTAITCLSTASTMQSLLHDNSKIGRHKNQQMLRGQSSVHQPDVCIKHISLKIKTV